MKGWKGLLAVATAAAAWSVRVWGQDAAPEGEEFTVVHTELPAKRGKPAPATVCWLPKGCGYVRGVIVGHPMIAHLATDARFRRVAAEEGLGTVLLNAFREPGTSWEQIDRVLDQWAEAAKHPEIRSAPVFVGGLSASVLWARLLVYERPERCFGILHVAGGNLHQQHPEGKTLSGVPFMAVNGEYESCGPEGGIRPHLGFDTQWYLMGEQMLERRRQDPNHLMRMVTGRSQGQGIQGRLGGSG